MNMNLLFHKIAWPIGVALFWLSIVIPRAIYFALGWLLGLCLITIVEVLWRYFRGTK